MRLISAAAALVLTLASPAVAAADPVRVEIISVKEEAGRITATITVYGTDGRPLQTLPEGALQGSLDGTRLPVAGVESASAARPTLSVVLVVDVSGSMLGDPINQARGALAEFVGSLSEGDQVALLAFDTRVQVLQDFTSDRALATKAVGLLNPLGDTALYDAVISATQKASEAQTERKIIVLLTDGIATVNLDRRAASLQAAQSSGVTFVPIGLGAQLDRPYLAELAAVSGGRFLEAPTPAALRQTYADLALAIRTNFTVTLTVPKSIDRSVPARLTLQATVGRDSAMAEKDLPPLAGAVPPPYDLNVSGIIAGARLRTPVTVEPVVPPGLEGVTVDFLLDGEPVHSAAAAPYTFQLDPSAMSAGNHILKVVATDAQGRTGEKQVPFLSVAPAKSGGTPTVLLALAAVLISVLPLGFLLLRRFKASAEEFVTRMRPWPGSAPGTAAPIPSPPEQWEPRDLPPSPLPDDRPLGRLIVIDEAAFKNGDLGAFREFEIGTSPLTLGTTSKCDIIIEDPAGGIAGEEARLWVQRDRLVYHKLSTLSAMATEGVTSGWHFLASGDDIRVGPCRIAFQLDVEPETPPPAPGPREQQVREIWPSEAPSLGSPSD